MKLKQILINKLSEIMPKNEATAEFDFIMLMKFGLNKVDYLFDENAIELRFNELENIVVERVSTRKPLQYILNRALFLNDTYFVDENVLIPRPETELLVNAVCRHADKNSKILEIGTGSGCIAISLAKRLQSDNITSVDVSFQALSVAEINAKTIVPYQKINFIQSDLFDNIHGLFDIIVSNPPYVSRADYLKLEPEVKAYEPISALLAEDDGFYFYNKIIEQSANFLNKNGKLIFEVGQNEADSVAFNMKMNFYNVVDIVKDLSKIERVVVGKLMK